MVSWIKVAKGCQKNIRNHSIWTSMNEVAVEGFLPESRILKNSRFITEIATSITFNHTEKDP
jgi:hypothetical protein